MAKRWTSSISNAALFLCSLLFLQVTTATTILPCYFPDETTIAPLHIQCNSSASNSPSDASACCRNYPNTYCASNGMCLYNGETYRGSCTDKTWKSPNCPQNCIKEHMNASVNIYDTGAPGQYTCGFQGDNYTDLNPWTINLRDDQKSAATSIPSKGSPHRLAIAVGVGVGVPLGVLLLASWWLLFAQQRRFKRAGTTRKSMEKPPDWQWPQGQQIPPPVSPPPPNSQYTSPAQYTSPTGFPVHEAPKAGPRIVQELRAQENESHELDSYDRPPSRPTRFV